MKRFGKMHKIDEMVCVFNLRAVAFYNSLSD